MLNYWVAFKRISYLKTLLIKYYRQNIDLLLQSLFRVGSAELQMLSHNKNMFKK